MENGDIPDANFEASHSSTSAHYARLNNSPTLWLVDGDISSPWIEVDIGYSTSVSGLLTQGYKWNRIAEYWITKLKVSTFTSADDAEVFIKDGNGADKVFIRL